jgi:hypothetical protein
MKHNHDTRQRRVGSGAGTGKKAAADGPNANDNDHNGAMTPPTIRKGTSKATPKPKAATTTKATRRSTQRNAINEHKNNNDGEQDQEQGESKVHARTRRTPKNISADLSSSCYAQLQVFIRLARRLCTSTINNNKRSPIMLVAVLFLLVEAWKELQRLRLGQVHGHAGSTGNSSDGGRRSTSSTTTIMSRLKEHQRQHHPRFVVSKEAAITPLLLNFLGPPRAETTTKSYFSKGPLLLSNLVQVDAHVNVDEDTSSLLLEQAVWDAEPRQLKPRGGLSKFRGAHAKIKDFGGLRLFKYDGHGTGHPRHVHYPFAEGESFSVAAKIDKKSAHVGTYLAFDDDTKRGEKVEHHHDSVCQRPEWYRDYYPNCNHFHEIDFLKDDAQRLG